VGTVNPGIDGAVTYKTIIIKLLQPNKDLLIVKAKGREDVFPQSGDPCDIKIENATVTATLRITKRRFTRYIGLSEDLCWRQIPLSTSMTIAFSYFVARQKILSSRFRLAESDHSGNEQYKKRIRTLYKQETELFRQLDSVPIPTPMNDTKTEYPFRGHCIDSANQEIPHGFRPPGFQKKWPPRT